MYEVKDSGNRREFATGSVRDMAEGKGRFDLIPFEALRRLAVHYEKGAIKYGTHNWKKGQPISVLLDSMLRHASKVTAGLEDEDHLAAVLWNGAAIIWTRQAIKDGILPRELEDVFTPEQACAFYGPVAQVQEPVAIEPVTVDFHAVEHTIVDDMASDGERSVLKILLEMRTRDVIIESDYLLAVADVRHCYSDDRVHTHDREQDDLGGWVTWSDTTQGHDFWARINRLHYEMRGGE